MVGCKDNKDRWATVERLKEAFQRERITGQIVLDFKDGELNGGKQTTNL